MSSVSNTATAEVIRTSDPCELHREACAKDLGISQGLLDDLLRWNRRGERTAHRERLVVAMRDTKSPSGLTFSFPEITTALRAKNHSTIITIYRRAKAKGAGK